MALVLVFMCLVATVPATCGDYCVDGESRAGPADDAGPGTMGKPWRTLGRICAEREPRPGAGDTVWIRGGTYDHALTLTTGGVEGQPLTISAYRDEEPVIDCGGELGRGVLFTEQGQADHIVLDGLTVRNVAPTGFGISASGRAGLAIRKVEVSGGRMGVWLGGCAGVELRESEIHHSVHGNVYVDSRNVGIEIADCHLHHTEESHGLSLYAPGDGVRVKGRLASLDVSDAGVATFGIEGVDLSKVRRGTLRGQDAEGAVSCPSVILLFAEEEPGPDASALPGGTLRLEDGRDWFILKSAPEWGGKPYSPDGKLGRFLIGDADPEVVRQAKYAYVTYLFDPGTANRDIKILRNEIDHARIQGIWVQRSEGVLIEGNRTHHNGASGIQIESLSRRIWIEGNRSFANGVRYNHETGIWLDETIDAVVQGNVCSENQKGMGVTQCEWVIVRGNILHNNRAQHVQGDPPGCRRNAGAFWFSGGRHYHLGAPPGATNNAFVHNTLVGNGAEESKWGGFMHGARGYPSVSANVVMNNLLLDPSGAAALDLARPPAVLDGNIYWAAGEFAAVMRGPDGDARFDLSDPGGLAAYRASTGHDVNSKVVAVELVDPDAGNLSLAPGTAGVGAGQPLARTIAAGTGRDIPVDRVACFTAGLRDRDGAVVKGGDVICVGGATARVTAIDRAKSILTVDAELTWEEGAGVGYEYKGADPDVGA